MGILTEADKQKLEAIRAQHAAEKQAAATAPNYSNIETPQSAQQKQDKLRRRFAVLAYIAGASLRQIGAILGTTPQSVSSRIAAELPEKMRMELASARFGLGRPILKPGQVSAMADEFFGNAEQYLTMQPADALNKLIQSCMSGD